ncbi:restriction endonuclease subunit S, partial [Helicobacter suis]|uniref:restriction endonuclease subunit S n=1 Tax=Helicobacter suis TaxID=104628 RepID=UPI0019686263
LGGGGGGGNNLTSKRLEWRKFRVGELFEVFKPVKTELKKRLLPTEHIEGYIPAITCTSQNNGVACYMPRENAQVLKNMISVAANGDAPAFYQHGEFVLLQDCYALKFKGQELKQEHYLFLVVCLNKVLKKYNWNNKSGWTKVSLEMIFLPCFPTGEIAFDLIKHFIKALEKQRIEKVKELWEEKLESYTRVIDQ